MFYVISDLLMQGFQQNFKKMRQHVLEAGNCTQAYLAVLYDRLLTWEA
jgi:hypothetical protein